MNEQFYIDWINSLEIPESVLIDKIEDLFQDNDILLNIISKVLNKKIEELMVILGKSKSLNNLKNISLITNLYFDYEYDYSNKNNLNKNTFKLIEFLKSRYPKETNNNKNVINDNYDINKLNEKNKLIKNNEKIPFRIKNNNKIKTEFELIKPQKKINTHKEQNKNFTDYPLYNFKTNPDISTENKNKIINNSYTGNSNNNKKIINKKTNYSFSKDNKSKIPKKPKLKINSSNNLRNFSTKEKLISKEHPKSLSSKNLYKSKKKTQTEINENNYNFSEKFVKQGMISKTPNYSLMIIGKPILKKDEFFYYYQFPKISSPITKINLETINNQKTNKNNYYKFPFLLQNLMIQKINNTNDKFENRKDSKFNTNEFEKKETLILEYLNKIGVINKEQKTKDYLWKILIPDLRDGYIIGKLINLLEKKNNNYLKGITKETFYKVNIYYNWKKIIDFLINRNAFNSIYLYQKNIYSNDKKLFNFLYDLLSFYHEKEKINENEYKNFNKKSNNIFKNKNLSNYSLIDNNQHSKNYSNIDKSIQNKSYNLTPITHKNRNNKNLKMSNTPSVSEIMNIRKSINYIHRENNSLIMFSNKEKINKNIDDKNLNKSEEYTNLNNKEKFNLKGENIQFDKNVNNIISFLKLIGINTSQINFYMPEMKIFKDGILLHQIINQLESNSTIIPKIDINPKNPSTAINNHRLIINFLIKYKKTFPIELTGKERELYNAKPTFILKFLNIIKSIYNNEVYYYEKINIKNKNTGSNKKIKNNMKINPKNIDKSERVAIPLSQELRDKFLIKDNAQIWA